MRDKKFKERRFTFRRNFFKNESSSYGDNERWEEKRDLVCLKCKKLRHIKYDCPLYKTKTKRRKKKTTSKRNVLQDPSFIRSLCKVVGVLRFSCITLFTYAPKSSKSYFVLKCLKNWMTSCFQLKPCVKCFSKFF